MKKAVDVVTLPQIPDTVNADRMTDEQILTKLQRGYDDFEAERVWEAASIFDRERRLKRL